MFVFCYVLMFYSLCVFKLKRLYNGKRCGLIGDLFGNNKFFDSSNWYVVFFCGNISLVKVDLFFSVFFIIYCIILFVGSW